MRRILKLGAIIEQISFNSRTLGRVRPIFDPKLASFAEFQFTHPGKGATLNRQDIFSYAPVSIHAPWEGCDYNNLHILLEELLFQFTHPGKGATSIGRRFDLDLFSFNSRTLGRVRPFKDGVGNLAGKFQFTHPGKGATSLPP